ncbi:unknown [Odoribacter splanchnicus CAG:14]|nr:unknown [Odoribacter splanchnicus CAG:14]
MPSTISSTACLPVESPMRQWTVEVEPGLSSPIIRMEGRAVLTSSTEENCASIQVTSCRSLTVWAFFAGS